MIRQDPLASSMINKGTPFFSPLGKVRVLHRIFGIFQLALLGGAVWGAVIALDPCPREVSIACFVTAAASAIRLIWMLGSAVSQAMVASTMLAERVEPTSVSSSIVAKPGDSAILSMRQKRRMWYVRWLWLGRFGMFVTLLQLLGAAYLTFSFVKNASVSINHCYSADQGDWHRGFFLALAMATWLLTIMQCCIGPDILTWSSLYARCSDAWTAYYRVMFDYGIREALCCLGRAQYITRDEDEVDSVAAVLGDLLSYRATGASHLEFFAGLALLQVEGPSVPSSSDIPAPESLIKEATILHPFAVAAYTGLLLDIGRNPLTFPCVWLHRQGVLTPWNRHRQPKLEGDNWWRGHAAAFLRHLKLPPEALRQGRVHQAKRECAYFIAVVHELQSVVVAVRGTETPEDLLTDGLGRESVLTDSDLIGLLQSKKIPETVMWHLLSSKPHFAHEGIIEAARELALQLDNFPEDVQWGSSSLGTPMETMAGPEKEKGILYTLLRPGGECEGYALRFVGHSLGGSIAAVTALRLLARYPELHVYGYGVLPCVDFSIADACSSFVTSIVYNDEFSSRLSVSSIKRLRVAAVKALAAESSSDSITITRLAQRLLGSQQTISARSNGGLQFTEEATVANKPNKHKHKRFKFRLGGRDGDNDAEESEVLIMNGEVERNGQSSILYTKPEGGTKHHYPTQEEVGYICEEDSQKGKALSNCDSSSNAHTSSVGANVFGEDNYCEMFVPGLIIHIVPVSKSSSPHPWDFWGNKVQQGCQHRAFIKDRRSFQDLVISASMFLDHLPWRCQHALNDVLENATKVGDHNDSDSLV